MQVGLLMLQAGEAAVSFGRKAAEFIGQRANFRRTAHADAASPVGLDRAARLADQRRQRADQTPLNDAAGDNGQDRSPSRGGDEHGAGGLHVLGEGDRQSAGRRADQHRQHKGEDHSIDPATHDAAL